MLGAWPWEILHDVFDYLTSFDLFRSFGSIEEYLSNVIRSYFRLNLNFQSIKKSHFDEICQFIHLEQIQSLIFADDGQMNLCFSRFHLDEFIYLPSVTLREISDMKVFEEIFTHLEDHRPIRSVSIVRCNLSIN